MLIPRRLWLALGALVAIGVPCVAIDSHPEHIEKALHRVSFLHVEGDASSEEALLKAGITSARGVNPTMRDRLLHAGASEVIFPDRIGGLRLAPEMSALRW